MIIEKLRKIFYEAVDDNSLNLNFEEKCSHYLSRMSISQSDIPLLLRELIKKDKYPSQDYGRNEFGQPSFTIFKEKELVLEILNWQKSSLAIHSHVFKGAFKVLGNGANLIKCEFTREKKIEDGVFLGKFNIQKTISLKFSEIDKIFSQEKGIHAIYHHGDKGMTLVLRSPHNKELTTSVFYSSGVECNINPIKELVIYKKFELYKFHQMMNFSEFLSSLQKYELYRSFLILKLTNEETLEYIKYFKSIGTDERIVSIHEQQAGFTKLLRIKK